MKRARFIAAARLEFLAEVIYHMRRNPAWASASPQQWKRPRLALLHSLSRAHLRAPRRAESL